MYVLWRVIVKEFLQLKEDRRMIPIIFVAPVIQIVLFGFAVNTDVTNVPTVLVDHNLDLAERVPLEEWDLVQVRGEYEFNAQGGVVHWTHRDPGMGIKHGWIEHKGLRYE